MIQPVGQAAEERLELMLMERQAAAVRLQIGSVSQEIGLFF